MNSDYEPALPKGFVIDKYSIEAALGTGGFGIVYKGVHKHPHLGDQYVAIKEYLPQDLAVREGTTVRAKSAQDAKTLQRYAKKFLAEARRLVRFQHPNIVRCLDYIEANGTAYLIMAYEDGESLSTLLRRRKTRKKPLGEDEIKQLFLPLLDGLAEAHAHDVLHRDIKPDNIFIRRADGRPLLLDFGAAKEGYSASEKSSQMVYTKGYAPLEQMVAAGRLGPWTDIYAMGAAMWRAVECGNARRLPNLPEAYDRDYATQRGQPDPLPTAVELGRGRYSPAFLRAIDKCLAIESGDRFQTVAELRQALTGEAGEAAARPEPRREVAIRQDEQQTERPDTDAPRSQHTDTTERPQTRHSPRGGATRRRGLTVAAALAALVAVFAAAGGYWYWRAQAPAAEISAAEKARRQTTLEEGEAAYFAKDYAAALTAFRPLAEQGEAQAQRWLGNMHESGNGVDKDIAQAQEWWRKAAAGFRRAAERGDAQAQSNLGAMYGSGHGVDKDLVQATRWHRKAAEQGEAQALYHLDRLCKEENHRPAC